MDRLASHIPCRGNTAFSLAFERGHSYTLDSVPRVNLERAIRSVASTLSPGESASIIFSAAGAHRPSFKSRQWTLLCMILAHSQPAFPADTGYTTSPLFLTVGQLLGMIEQINGIVIDDLHNISAKHVGNLLTAPTWSLQRKQVLFRRLEAEAYALTWIARWEVTVRRL